jgi:ubiquinone/menaquinone biosynthesis C-methylase UbiE
MEGLSMTDRPWGIPGVSGAEYDARFAALAQAGNDVHGEANFVAALGVSSVLDAGCGTGRWPSS